MDAEHLRWDSRSAEEWLEEADRFEKMAGRFDRHPQLNASFAALARDARMRADVHATTPSDFDYFRMRAARERWAAGEACDKRVRRVHLEMAERYQALILREANPKTVLRLVS